MTPDAAQPARRRRAQSKRQLSGQILIGDSAHPVGAEQSSHADKLLIDSAAKGTTADVSARAAAEPVRQRDRKGSPPASAKTRAVRTLSRTYLAVVGAAVLGLGGVVATLPSPGAFSAARPF